MKQRSKHLITKQEKTEDKMKLVKTNDGVATLRPFGGLVEDLFNGSLGRWIDEDLSKANLLGLFPPVNIRETKEAYELELVAPGLEKEDFKIKLEGKTLFISAEKKQQDQKEGSRHIRHEYSFRAFKRSFTVDEAIDTAKIDAKYDQGILKVSLPKHEAQIPQEKEIAVN
jgi:HSP20 family protein